MIFLENYKAYPLWFCEKTLILGENCKAYPLWFFWDKLQGLPLVIFWFLGKITRLTPCDFSDFGRKLQGLPLVICLILGENYKAYPLWFFLGKLQGLPLVIFLIKLQGLPLVIFLIFGIKLQGLPLVIFFDKTARLTPCDFVKKNTRWFLG